MHTFSRLTFFFYFCESTESLGMSLDTLGKLLRDWKLLMTPRRLNECREKPPPTPDATSLVVPTLDCKELAFEPNGERRGGAVMAATAQLARRRQRRQRKALQSSLCRRPSSGSSLAISPFFQPLLVGAFIASAVSALRGKTVLLFFRALTTGGDHSTSTYRPAGQKGRSHAQAALCGPQAKTGLPTFHLSLLRVVAYLQQTIPSISNLLNCVYCWTIDAITICSVAQISKSVIYILFSQTVCRLRIFFGHLLQPANNRIKRKIIEFSLKPTGTEWYLLQLYRVFTFPFPIFD